MLQHVREAQVYLSLILYITGVYLINAVVTGDGGQLIVAVPGYIERGWITLGWEFSICAHHPIAFDARTALDAYSGENELAFLVWSQQPFPDIQVNHYHPVGARLLQRVDRAPSQCGGQQCGGRI